MKTRIAASTLVLLSLAALSACSDYRDDEGDPVRNGERTAVYSDQSRGVIDRFLAKDPTIQKFFDNSYGYAVFPKIGKGAVGVGAANGTGDVFEQGVFVGTAEMTQVTVGLQLGGQTYSEIIFFEDQGRLDHFKAGNTEFSANASAIAAESGAARANDFHEGHAVFTMPRGGLMFEASIGGQKFSFRPSSR